jgi:hypothetical protein
MTIDTTDSLEKSIGTLCDVKNRKNKNPAVQNLVRWTYEQTMCLLFVCDGFIGCHYFCWDGWQLILRS